jgi:hypothetical protein
MDFFPESLRIKIDVNIDTDGIVIPEKICEKLSEIFILLALELYNKKKPSKLNRRKILFSITSTI